jgi:2-keto-4-pentenoate hydratase/2-oxohepta-3-ene-1,7-dioic acid hydratase in catechol pathway
MKIGTCRFLDKEHVFVADGDLACLPALDPALNYSGHASVLNVVGAGSTAWGELGQWVKSAPQTAKVAIRDLELLAPIPRPTKNVMCLGWNYREHVTESADASQRNAELPEHPIVFTKSVSSVTGPYAGVPYDGSVSREIDWEVELGVVIGTPAHKLTEQQALTCIFGYTVINDISARDLQFRHEQFFIGKSLPGACPMGPWIVTADEIADPQDLDLRCRVNDDTKQESNTRYMIFDVATIIAILSRSMVLEPGDIIATGTPSGVGFAQKPPQYLVPGDVVECEVAGIGKIRNRISG